MGDAPNRNLKIVQTVPELNLRDPFRLVAGIRTIVLVFISLVILTYQIRLGPFAMPNQSMVVFACLLASFLFNAIALFKIDVVKKHSVLNLLLFSIDTVLISLIVYFGGIHQSIYLLIFLIHLFLGSVLFSREESWVLVLITSICFNALMIFTPEMSGQELMTALIINNVAFVVINYLSGQVTGQLKLTETRLEETHSTLVSLQNFNDLIIDGVRAGIVVVSRTGFVQFYNPEAKEILKHLIDLQVKVSDLFPSVDWADVFKQGLSGDVIRQKVEVEINSEKKVLELKLAEFFDDQERSKGWLFLIEDRTEINSLEMELRQKEKLAAVGQLAAGIAHEIRNPLASISGSVQMMSSSEQTSEENRKLMNIMIKEIDRLNNLISEFLNYVRPEAVAQNPVDINQVLRECLEMLKFNTNLRSDVKIETDLGSAAEILGDRDKLKQAMLNFLINAYQAMDKISQPVLSVLTKDEGQKVVVVIKDNGCGISPDNLHRIFEPFHTTKPKGTGLGLAITHKVLEAHGARVLVDSKLQEGTRFLMEFPSVRGNFFEFNPNRKQA